MIGGLVALLVVLAGLSYELRERRRSRALRAALEAERIETLIRYKEEDERHESLSAWPFKRKP